MIIINTPKVISQTQNYEIVNILQQKIDGQWRAEIQSVVLDDNGNIIDTVLQEYSGESYNNWFRDYNSGSFLVQNLITDENLNIAVPPNIEDEFIN